MGVESYLTREKLLGEIAPQLRALLGSIRKVGIIGTARALWTLRGHDQVSEKPVAEAFTGIGFYARPIAGADAEAIVLNVAGAGNPVVIATRDEAARRMKAADAGPGDTVVFNRAARVIIKADGTIEVTGAKVKLGEGVFVEAGPTSEGVVRGTGTDPFTGLTYAALGNASTKVFAK